MGRWYFGDIEGKFWFGVQASDDASNFGVDYTEVIQWDCICKSCKCRFIEEHPDTCIQCKGECDKTECEVSFIRYNFTSDHIDDIQIVLDDIKSQIPFQELTDEFIESVDEEKQALLARWDLGMKILKCLENGSCQFDCEL